MINTEGYSEATAPASGVVLGGVAEVVGSNLARGKIFTASIGSVDSLYPSVFIYCLNLHQFLILCSLKAMMFVKLYFRTSDIYLISLVASASGVVLGGYAEVVGSHLARGKIFTASIGSIDSLYPSVYIYI